MVTVTLAIHIDAPPEQVAAIYLDVANWHRTFPATIKAARVVRESLGEIFIEVDHVEGRVPNVLRPKSPTRIDLEEDKRRYHATFSNEFQAEGGGTRYSLDAHVQLKGANRLLAPLVGPLIRSRMRRFVLEPMKVAAER